ncbi:hypothetical protein T12_9004 [Trichinella patagoniensis]|uniref:Uncharacterized protein n=1 Tax=Trichinella patagoniensis TaxID=990121 RepID=A0A0V0XYB0_9BILA|nr:hypothetical protein T12_9004 [Trichinella patagoniensis]
MFKRNLGGREFYQFPSVAALRENGETFKSIVII